MIRSPAPGSVVIMKTTPRRSRLATALLPVVLCAAALVVLGGQKMVMGWNDAQAPDGLDESLSAGQPSVDRLDAELRDSVWRAAATARQDGYQLVLNSGWRSKGHQQRLRAEAVETYGNQQEADRFVATPRTSAHVRGKGVDIGPPEVAAWLDRQGAAFGLCRTFANETWHFERVAVAGRCPRLLPDASVLR